MTLVTSILRGTLRRAALALALFAIACSEAPSSPGPIEPHPSRASISIVAPPGDVYVGDELTLSAVVRDSLGQVVSNAPLEFFVENPADAEVAGDGILFLRPATVRLIARSGDVSATRDIAVRALTVDSVAVVTSPMAILEREVRPIGVRVIGPGDRTVRGRPVRVAIEDSSIATIDASGRLHALRAGVTHIVATVDGKTGRGRVQVLAVPGRYELARWNDGRVPALYMIDTLYVGGRPEYHELYLERGELAMTSDQDARYIASIIITDYVITYVDGYKLMTPRYVQTTTDRGTFLRHGDGSVRFTSDLYYPLDHSGRLEGSWMRMFFTIPGEAVLNLSFRPAVD